MDGVIDFVVSNWQWVLLGALLVVMIIVGYIADKTDFGRNKKKQNNAIVPATEKVLDVDNLQGKTLSDMVSQNGGATNVNNQLNEDLNVPFGDSISSNDVYAPLKEDLNAPFGDDKNKPAFQANGSVMSEIPANFTEITNNNEDLNAPFGDSSSPKVEPQTTDNLTDINSNLNVPLENNSLNIVNSDSNINAVNVENPIQETINVQEASKVEAQNDLPASAESAYENKIVPEVITDQLGENEVSSVDDIWKF